MCMPDMTEKEKDEILKACREMTHLKGFIATIQERQNTLDLENKHLKEKIEDEIKERKEEIKEMKDLFNDFKKGIENQFSVIFGRLNDIQDKISATLGEMNKHIRNGLYALLAITLAGFASFWVAKILQAF